MRLRLYELLRRLAASELPVLILGETGIGKENWPPSRCTAGRPRDGPFVDAQLRRDPGRAGRERAVRPRARGRSPARSRRKAGALEARRRRHGVPRRDRRAAASRMQAKLLRVLEGERSRRVGGTRERDGRHPRRRRDQPRPRGDEVKAGPLPRRTSSTASARATVVLPPLRERPRRRSRSSRAASSPGLRARAPRAARRSRRRRCSALVAYDWPGNVRELRNVIEYAAATVAEATLEPWHLPDRSPASKASSAPRPVAAAAAAGTRSFRAHRRGAARARARAHDGGARGHRRRAATRRRAHRHAAAHLRHEAQAVRHLAASAKESSSPVRRTTGRRRRSSTSTGCSPLGRGAMGQVFLAHDTLLDRPVAVKFIAGGSPDPALRERFFVEARAIARLPHPNVVAVYRVGEVRGRPYLVSEFVRGRTLAELPKPVPPARLVEIGVGLARGLAAAHRRGVLHRDIKPANAMISDERRGQAARLRAGQAGRGGGAALRGCRPRRSAAAIPRWCRRRGRCASAARRQAVDPTPRRSTRGRHAGASAAARARRHRRRADRHAALHGARAVARRAADAALRRLLARRAALRAVRRGAAPPGPAPELVKALAVDADAAAARARCARHRSELRRDRRSLPAPRPAERFASGDALRDALEALAAVGQGGACPRATRTAASRRSRPSTAGCSSAATPRSAPCSSGCASIRSCSSPATRGSASRRCAAPACSRASRTARSARRRAGPSSP